MSTPTKFDIGGVPRTRTGLVPTSYRQSMDNMSTPKQWGQLPVKPKPTMYPFRGDFVNERNRRIARQRKRSALKQKQSLLDSSRNESDSCGSTLLVTPRSANSSRNSSVTRESESPAPDATKKWDSYCKHISWHKLSEEEESVRSQNKNKYTSYLRECHSKRQASLRLGRKKDEERQQKDPQHSVQKRKPPVPRLSRIARSVENKENSQNGQAMPLSGTASKSPCSSNGGQLKGSGRATVESTKTKVRYLDFISKKVEQAPKMSLKHNVMPLGRSNDADDKNKSMRPDSEEDDEDSTFHSQIERIVKRAAEMVLTEQCKAKKGPGALDETCDNDSSRNDSPRDENGDSSSSITTNIIPQKKTFELNGGTPDASNDMAILNEKFKSKSSSGSQVGGNFEDSNSQEKPRKNGEVASAVLRESDENTFSIGTYCDGDSLSEMVPQTQIKSLSIPSWKQSSVYKSMNDYSYSIDSSSFTTCNLSASVSTSEFSDISAFDDSSHIHNDTATPDEISINISSRHGNSDVTNKTISERIPRKQSHLSQILEQNPNLEPSPEVKASLAQPPIEPWPREVHFDDEPIPRGHEQFSQPVDDTGKIMNESKSIVDDLFTLLG